MTFKPNYGQKRAERARAQEEKRNQRVKDQHERAVQRRAEADAAEQATDDKIP